MIINYLLLAFFVSMDALGIGITYGMKHTKISPFAKLILAVITIIIATFSIFLGQFLFCVLPTFLVNFIGTIIFLFMGGWIIYQSFRPNTDTSISSNTVFEHSPQIKTFFIQCFGITIQIIRNPISSDLDHSHNIDWKESIFLGIALSLDLFCVGMGSSMIGLHSLLFPILVATFQLCFLSLGSYLGKKLSSIRHLPDYTWNLISGIFLIGIGICKLFF